MAKQVGPILLKGLIGDLSYYMANGQHLVRQKPGPSKGQVHSSPNFKRTRENVSDFVVARRISSTIGELLRITMTRECDGQWANRLYKLVWASSRYDSTNHRGSKKPWMGDMRLLEGYDFNIARPLRSVFQAQFDVEVLEAEGKVKLEVPAFHPRKVAAPASATHMSFVWSVGSIDNENGNVTLNEGESEKIALKAFYSDPVSLELEIPEVLGGRIYVLLGISFHREVATDVIVKLQEKRTGSLSIVKVAAISEQ
jgi:hypothetical protein